MNCTKYLGLAVFLFSAVSIAEASPLRVFEKFPHDKTYTLSNGQKILLPVHDRGCQSLIVSGTVPSREAEKRLPEGLFPVLKNAQKAYAVLQAFHCEDTSEGPLDEFYVFLMANPIRKAGNLLQIANDNLSLFALKKPFLKKILGRKRLPIGTVPLVLAVKTELEIFPGAEIWGLPAFKTLVSMTRTENEILAQVVEDGLTSVTLRVELSDQDVVGRSTYTAIERPRFYIPQRDGGFRETRPATQGRGRLHLSAASSIELEPHPDSRVGNLIRDLRFVAEGYEWDPDFNVAFGAGE